MFETVKAFEDSFMGRAAVKNIKESMEIITLLFSFTRRLQFTGWPVQFYGGMRKHMEVRC